MREASHTRATSTTTALEVATLRPTSAAGTAQREAPPKPRRGSQTGKRDSVQVLIRWLRGADGGWFRVEHSRGHFLVPFEEHVFAVFDLAHMGAKQRRALPRPVTKPKCGDCPVCRALHRSHA
jgi:hypothetical protein